MTKLNFTKVLTPFQERQMRKMRQRQKALNKLPRIGGLNKQAIAQRVKTIQAQQDADKVTFDCEWPALNTTIYCKHSGMYIGAISESVIHEMLITHQSEYIKTQGFNQLTTAIHPCWIDSSPEKLRELQLQMPHEFVVNGFRTLMKDNKSGEFRNTQLTLLNECKLEQIVELAELIRIALGLFGKHEAICHSMPSCYLTTSKSDSFDTGMELSTKNRAAADLASIFDNEPQLSDNQLQLKVIIGEMKTWLQVNIAAIQRKIHKNNQDRAQCLTLADLKNMQTSVGMVNYRESKQHHNVDMEILAELDDIFGEFSGLTCSMTYTKKEKPVIPKFGGKLFSAIKAEPVEPVELDEWDTLQTEIDKQKTAVFQNPSNAEIAETAINRPARLPTINLFGGK